MIGSNLTLITSSSMSKSSNGGMIPAPIPWILCVPTLSFEPSSATYEQVE